MTVTVRCHQLSVSVDEAVLLPETSFSAEEPALIALTGANGTGKTTLLKTLVGRQLPSTGEGLINGQQPYEFDPVFRAAVASLIDTPPMARDMTLTEQLALVRISWGAEDAAAAFTAAEQTLQQLTIGELGDRFPYELSAGQLQLFAVGLTLSRPFSLLLLDEPERHLDTDRVEALITLLEQRVAEGALVITATHRQEIISRAGRQLDLNPIPDHQ
ncbi:ABC transporter ATP-binding protein [Nesterenkonia ebinurensis]|uniref:ABC transporter ATP-binding protein n=1 Tax=Nesterenkonia ebinurensis TaxID=2608252 RepID=UPI00123D4F7E|nr:ATP-binding cassette domain-containing protein [Nesterenkonia ebinurensis]